MRALEATPPGLFACRRKVMDFTNTEVALAIIAVIGTIAGALVYMARKWADSREKMLEHQIEMEKQKMAHDQEIEDRRSEREQAQIQRDVETSKYIASNTAALHNITETLRGLTDSVNQTSTANLEAMNEVKKAIQSELGNGLTGVVRQNTEQTTRNHEMIKEILAVVKCIERDLGSK
jgi:hypothetical protein